MAKLTESHLRKIIKEELSKVLGLNEGQDYKSLADIAIALEQSGNKQLADNMRADAHYKKNNGKETVSLGRSGDGSNIVLSWLSGQTYTSIPLDAAKKLV